MFNLRLKELRKKKDLTQEELAKATNVPTKKGRPKPPPY
jgi:transcriptional regulator with XRE-family HTH domain